MEKFEPIGLRNSQFGLVAAITILAGWIPNLLSIAPVLHVVKMDIAPTADDRGNELLVEILETSEIRANGSAVTLVQLSMLARTMNSENDEVILKPHPCSPYDTVIKTIVALKMSTAGNLGFAVPDYQTSFGKASSGPHERASEGVPSFNAASGTDYPVFKPLLATTIPLTNECQQKAFSNQKSDEMG